MINHIRTLLLNRQFTFDSSYPAEEPIDPDFTPVSLPIKLDSINKIFFGKNPDRYMLNIRAFELLKTLDNSIFEKYILEKDRRTTFYPFRRDILNNVFGVTVAPSSSNSANSSLTIVNSSLPKSKEVLYRQWEIKIINRKYINITETAGGSASYIVPFVDIKLSGTIDLFRLSFDELYYMTLDDTYEINIQETAVQSIKSRHIELHNTDLTIEISGEINDSWTITLIGRPYDNINDILSKLENVITSDFFINHPEFINYWNGTNPVYKLASVIVEYTDQIYTLMKS